MGIEAGNAEIDFMLGVENADFGFLCRRLPLKRLSLPKVGNRGGLLPQEVVQCAVQLGGSVNADCLGHAERLLGPDLGLLRLWIRL